MISNACTSQDRKTDRSESLDFDVIQQFVVVPDRRYRVEWRNGILNFIRTGSQFDAQWVARGATNVLGPKIEAKLKTADPQKLFLWGLVIAGVSAVVLVGLIIGLINYPSAHSYRRLAGLGVPFFGLILGLVMIIGGICSRKGAVTSGNFSLPLSQITEAALLPVQSEMARRGEPQAGRVRLGLMSGKNIQLSIPTEQDLAAISSLIPLR